MNKKQLLDKLAKECPTWSKVEEMADASSRFSQNHKNAGMSFVIINDIQISYKEWYECSRNYLNDLRWGDPIASKNKPSEQDEKELSIALDKVFSPAESGAQKYLSNAAKHMQERAHQYDAPEGERSMAATVSAFNAVTSHSLTEEQGWLFMELLKIVRSQQGGYREDNYDDAVAYAALRGESAAKERK